LSSSWLTCRYGKLHKRVLKRILLWGGWRKRLSRSIGVKQRLAAKWNKTRGIQGVEPVVGLAA
jgi:hypothetical protein